MPQTIPDTSQQLYEETHSFSKPGKKDIPSSFRSHTLRVLPLEADTRIKLPSGAKVKSLTTSVWSTKLRRSFPKCNRRGEKTMLIIFISFYFLKTGFLTIKKKWVGILGHLHLGISLVYQVLHDLLLVLLLLPLKILYLHYFKMDCFQDSKA